MFHSAPARPGKQVAQGVDSIGLAVARVTWKISLASSGSEIWCAPAASRPAEDTSAATPAAAGADAHVREVVVGGPDKRPRLSVGMPVDGVVGLRIVGVAVEVPARDVVRVAVFVIVEAPARRTLHDQVVLDFAVAKGDDQILGRDPARLRVGASDARVLRVILDADDPVTVEVVGALRLPARV